MMVIASTFLAGRKKGLLMKVCARLEGSGNVYKSGSGKTKATERRELMYETPSRPILHPSPILPAVSKYDLVVDFDNIPYEWCLEQESLTAANFPFAVDSSIHRNSDFTSMGNEANRKQKRVLSGSSSSDQCSQNKKRSLSGAAAVPIELEELSRVCFESSERVFEEGTDREFNGCSPLMRLPTTSATK
jgi:hypothetical protein